MDKCCGVHFLTWPPGNASVSNSESIAANRNAREFFVMWGLHAHQWSAVDCNCGLPPWPVQTRLFKPRAINLVFTMAAAATG